MKARRFGVAILSFLALALAGCDSFSLPKLLTRPEDRVLALAVDRPAAERLVGSIGLIPSGGTAPYSYELSAVALYSKTNTQGIGTIANLTYSAGGAIGEIRITVTDAAGDSTSTTIKVLPPAPTLSGNRTGDRSTATISWTYTDMSIVDSLVILRSFNGGPFDPLTTSTTAPSSYPENGLNKVQPYTYRIYALAGDFASPVFDFTL